MPYYGASDYATLPSQGAPAIEATEDQSRVLPRHAYRENGRRICRRTASAQIRPLLAAQKLERTTFAGAVIATARRRARMKTRRRRTAGRWSSSCSTIKFEASTWASATRRPSRRSTAMRPHRILQRSARPTRQETPRGPSRSNARAQYMMEVDVSLRTNIDYCAMPWAMRENRLTNARPAMQKLYKYYFGQFSSFSDVDKVMTACTQDYRALVLDGTLANNANPTDCVMWYRASTEVPASRLCRPVYWSWARRSARERLGGARRADARLVRDRGGDRRGPRALGRRRRGRRRDRAPAAAAAAFAAAAASPSCRRRTSTAASWATTSTRTNGTSAGVSVAGGAAPLDAGVALLASAVVLANVVTLQPRVRRPAPRRRRLRPPAPPAHARGGGAAARRRGRAIAPAVVGAPRRGAAAAAARRA